ncbi:MAG TPA: hypothetical protein VIL29_02470, partial [Pseudothermotoga sp.]
ILYLFAVIAVFALTGCLSLFEPNVGEFSERIVKDINDYLKNNVDANYLTAYYVYINEPATTTDALCYCSKLLDFFDENASEISLVSYGDTGLKSFELKQPPSWVEKVYVLNLLMKNGEKVQTGSCPMLLIDGKPYLLTVYASGTEIVSYPLLGE